MHEYARPKSVYNMLLRNASFFSLYSPAAGNMSHIFLIITSHRMNLKSCTGSREFGIYPDDLRTDSSFPNAKRISFPPIATARRRTTRKFICECEHEILAHLTDCSTFMMFIFCESVSINEFLDCSVEGCHCQCFESEVSIKDLEVELLR